MERRKYIGRVKEGYVKSFSSRVARVDEKDMAGYVSLTEIGEVHRPFMAGAFIATKQIARQLFWWGIPKTYRLNQTVAASKWDDVKPETKAKIGRKAVKIAKKARKRLEKARRGLRHKFIIKMMGNMQKSGFGTPRDAAYRKEQGWI